MAGGDRGDPSGCGLDETVVEEPGGRSASGSFTDLVGETVGRYRVLELLGHGGMGVVFLAEDPSLGRRVAIKLMHERVELESRGRQRLEREARSLAALSHPNVVHVYEIGAHRGRVYVAMEHVPGLSLRAWLGERRRSWREIVSELCNAGDGLAAAHRAGIVHRDFKPDNVIVDVDGRPRVLDFGLAVASGAEDTGGGSIDAVAADVDSGALTATGTVMGTPAYMAPEQHAGTPPDARTDQFAFCVTLWEALYGVRPFSGDSFENLRENVVRGKITTPPSVRVHPRRLEYVLRRGLSRTPAERWPSMIELLAELRAIASPRSRRGAALAIASLVAGGGAIAVAVALAMREPPPAEPTPAAVEDEPAAAAAREPWRISLEHLTKTPPPGIEAAAIDRAGEHILYSLGPAAWVRAISGGAPAPVQTPGRGEPWFLAFAPDGSYLALVDAVMWRFREGGEPERLFDGVPSLSYLALAPDGKHIAGIGDLKLMMWTVGGEAKTCRASSAAAWHGTTTPRASPRARGRPARTTSSCACSIATRRSSPSSDWRARSRRGSRGSATPTSSPRSVI